VSLLQKGPASLERLGLQDSVQDRDASVSLVGRGTNSNKFLSASKQGVYFWAGKSGNQERSGASPYTVPNDLHYGPDWSWTLADGDVYADPVIDDDRNVFLTTQSGSVRKFNSSGHLLWHFSAEQQLDETPVLYDGALYLSTRNSEIIAVSQSTGKSRWRRKVGLCATPDMGALQAANGLVIVSASSHDCTKNDILVAVSSETGDKRWIFTPGAEVQDFFGPVSKDSLIFEDAAGSVYSLNISTGQALWNHTADAGVRSGFTVIGPNQSVFVTTNINNTGHLNAYNLTTGKALWHSVIEMPIITAPAVGILHPAGRGTPSVIFGIDDGEETRPAHVREALIAFDASTGSRLNWTFTLPNGARPEPQHQKGAHLNTTDARGNGTAAAMLSTHQGCLDLRGRGAGAFSDPIIAGDGTVYVGHRSGWLYAVRDKDGDSRINTTFTEDYSEAGHNFEVSTFYTEGSFHATPGIAPGMLVAANCRGLHVFTSF